jgi:catechol 2,3-dioxygenase-like lactoylglutathione lyase family enzyme
MSNTEIRSTPTVEGLRADAIEMKLEVVVIPVSDVNRAKRFYSNLGWGLDIDFSAEDDYRVIQFTPPGSGCSIIFGKNVTVAAPGSAQGLHLVVSDIVSTRDKLLSRGIEIGELFHDAGGVFHHADVKSRLRGPNPQRRSYASYASFSDPDGNGWLLQEVTVRLPGDVETRDTSFTSELLNVLRHAGNDAPRPDIQVPVNEAMFLRATWC